LLFFGVPNEAVSARVEKAEKPVAAACVTSEAGYGVSNVGAQSCEAVGSIAR
jgi:hypothetical protein